METPTRYLVVDDDKANNLLCKVVLKKVLGDIDIVSYDIPREALNYILDEYGAGNETKPTILFLDINMPEISGWDFLEIFKTYDEAIHKQFTVYILSSSVDYTDKGKADSNPLVKGYIEKPLTRDKIKNVFGVE